MHVATGDEREVGDARRAHHRLERAPELRHVLHRGVAVGGGVPGAGARRRGRHDHDLGEAVRHRQRRQAHPGGLARRADPGGGVEAQRVPDDVGDRRAGQRHAHPEALGRRADQTVDVGEGETGVGQGALHALPVEVGLRARRQITLFGHVHAGDRGVAQVRHGSDRTG